MSRNKTSPSLRHKNKLDCSKPSQSCIQPYQVDKTTENSVQTLELKNAYQYKFTTIFYKKIYKQSLWVYSNLIYH